MNILLSIFDFDIFKYWDMITQYVNPATIILWGITGGIAGFVIVLITEIILRKKILVNRRHWSLKILAYAYMVFFPLFAGYCFTQWFAVHALEREVVKNIPTYLTDANSVFNSYLKDEVEKVVDTKYLQSTGNEILDKGVAFTNNALNEYLKGGDSNIKTQISAYLAQSDLIKSKISEQLTDKISEQLKIDQEIVRQILDVKLQNILDDGALNNVVEKYITDFTGSLKMNALLIFLIGIAIPLIEIIIAHILEKKRLNRLPIQEQTPANK